MARFDIRYSSAHLFAPLCLALLAVAPGCQLVASLKGGPARAPSGGGPAIASGAGPATPAAAGPATPAAAAGDPDAPPAGSPAWCKGHRGSTETAHLSLKTDLEGGIGQPAEGWFSPQTVSHLALAACAWRRSASETAQIQQIYRQRRAELAKLGGLGDAEIDALLTAHFDQTASAPAEREFCDERNDDKAGPREVAERASRRYLGCPGRHEPGSYDWFDASEVQKLAENGGCMSRLAYEVDHKFDQQSPLSHRLRFAECNVMVSRLDAARFASEIASWPGIPRTWAKIRRGVIAGDIAHAQDYYKQIAAKDPEWRPLLFDEPERGYKAFVAAYQAHKPLFDKVHDLVSNAGNRKLARQRKGCQAEFWAPLSKAIAAKRPATVDAAVAALREQATFVLAWGFVACAHGDDARDVVAAFSPPISHTSSALSPRRAAFWSAVGHVNAHSDELMSDVDRSMGFSTGGTDGLELDGKTVADAKAVIASAAPAGDGKIRITFKTESWMEDKFNCVETNKIDGIKADGKLVYRQRCTFAGQVKVSSTQAPIIVDARFAGALKPGRLLEFNVSSAGDQRLGMPRIVRASKDAKAPLLGYLGFSW